MRRYTCWLVVFLMAAAVCAQAIDWPTPQIQGSITRPQWSSGTVPPVILDNSMTDWAVVQRSTGSAAGTPAFLNSKPGADFISLSSSGSWAPWSPDGMYTLNLPGGTVSPGNHGIGTDAGTTLTIEVDLALFESGTFTVYGGRECITGKSPKVYARGEVWGDFLTYTNERWGGHTLQIADIGFNHEAIIWSFQISNLDRIDNPRFRIHLYGNATNNDALGSKFAAVSFDGVYKKPAFASILPDTGVFALGFGTLDGKTYTLQQCTDLNDPAGWTNVPGYESIPGTGDAVQVTPPPAEGAMFRVLEQP